MKQVCKNCRESTAKFPIRDNKGKLIIKNFFKMELRDVAFFIILALLIFSYQSETKECEDAINDPCLFCEKSNCCNQPLYCYADYIGNKTFPKDPLDFAVVLS